MAAYEEITISFVETNGSVPSPTRRLPDTFSDNFDKPLSGRVHRIRYTNPRPEEYGFLGCNCVWLAESSTFRRKILPLSSGLNRKQSKIPGEATLCLQSALCWSLAWLPFHSEDVGVMFLRNVWISSKFTALEPKIRLSSWPLPSNP
jgi:hypothetical protein